MIDISGLDKAEILATLYNHSAPMGMGVLQARSGEMTTEIARAIINGGHEGRDYGIQEGHPAYRKLYFDYLFGRPLKIDLSGDSLDPWGYDRDNGGEGTAERLISELRSRTTV